MKLPVPNDWDEEQDGYSVVFACIPNSPMWRATYKGLFYQLTWWHVWDKETGSINGAKAIANQVYEELCMANCQDIVNHLDRIATALETLATAPPQTPPDDQTKQIWDSINEILGGDSVVLPETVPDGQ